MLQRRRRSEGRMTRKTKKAKHVTTDRVPDALASDQDTSRHSGQALEPPLFTSAARPAPSAPRTRIAPETSRRYVTPVRRRDSIQLEPIGPTAASTSDDEDLFSIPTRVSINVPISLLQDAGREPPPRRRRYWLWTAGSVIALVATVGVVRATGSESLPVTAADASPTISMEAVNAPRADIAPAAPVIGDGPCRLSVLSTPVGATVSLDGIEQGESPLTLAASCGEHRIDVAHASHASRTVLAALASEFPQTLDVTLPSRIDAVLVVSKPAGATVYLGGKPVGITPRRLDVLANSPLTLELRKRGFRTVATKIQTTMPSTQVVVRLTPTVVARR
jgi:hypothetical protein